jgi:hypothetical protein
MHVSAKVWGWQVKREAIDHPDHYGGDTTYEAIKVIEAWDLGFCLGNTVKYIARAGRKDPAKIIEDLRKAAWYLNREIQSLSSNDAATPNDSQCATGTPAEERSELEYVAVSATARGDG